MVSNMPTRISQFESEGWRFIVTQSHILDSKCKMGAKEDCVCKFCVYSRTLESYSHWPDMIFADDTLLIENMQSQACIKFVPLDALKMINPNRNNDHIKVASSKEWRSAREDVIKSQHFTDLNKYDWTYTTEYKGTVKDIQFEDCCEGIDLDKLRVQEPILFYKELVLYEDELDDNGSASLKVKFRVMPSGFFALCRFYLRVDQVCLRIVDTRLYYQNVNKTIIREATFREAAFSDPRFTKEMKENAFDSNRLWEELPLISKQCHIAHFQ